MIVRKRIGVFVGLFTVLGAEESSLPIYGNLEMTALVLLIEVEFPCTPCLSPFCLIHSLG